MGSGMPSQAREWSAERVRKALDRGRKGRKLSVQDLFLLLTLCVSKRALGHISSWYRYCNDEDSKGPAPFVWPIIADILDCEIEDLTREPRDLIANPDEIDWDKALESDDRTAMRPKPKPKGKKAS